MELSRRAALRAFGVAGLAVALPGCAADFSGTRLRIATGGRLGNYYPLGRELQRVWREQVGVAAEALPTEGSRQNLQLLAEGAAEIAFTQVDIALERERDLRELALARIYDEAVQVVVAAASPITALQQLRGRRVSLGAAGSGVRLVAERVLAAVGLSGDRDVASRSLDIGESVTALEAGTIDAFFWCGGVPTLELERHSTRRPVRLLDLGDVRPAVRRAHREYAPGTVPTGTYGLSAPTATLTVRNFLLASPSVDAELARLLTAAMFGDRDLRTRLSLDTLSAVFTQPVELHPGARTYYEDVRSV